jgi:membrane protein implicated in regulation of membrane protease activity
MIKEKISKEKSELIRKKNKLMRDFSEAKKDTRVFALLFIEFAVSVAIALSIYFYLDPEVEIKELRNVPFYLKLIAFIALMFLLAMLFHKTKEFREERKSKN